MPNLVGATPINQLNALPIFTLSQFAQGGGEITLIPGIGITRYFDPAATNLNGVSAIVPDPLEATYFVQLSNYLDVRGCTRFTAQVCWVWPFPPDVVRNPAVELFIQSPVPGPGGTVVDGETGQPGLYEFPRVGTTTLADDLSHIAQIRTGTISWQVGNGGAGMGGVYGAGAVGVFRLWFRTDGATVPTSEGGHGIGTNLPVAYVSLWGSS